MSALPKTVGDLLTEAAAAFAAKRSRLWLIAFPAKLSLERCDGEAVGRPEYSSKCGKIIDNVVYLPLRCFTVVGSANLGDNKGRVTFLIDAADKTTEQFADFSRRAGAALAAYPPPWFSVTGNGKPDELWAMALMFMSPKARREYPQWRRECRIISEPWGASCDALQAWLEDPGSDTRGGGAQVKGTIAYAIGVLAIHPDWNNKQIADKAEMHPGTLSNSIRFKAARAAIKEAGKLTHRKSRNRGGDMDEYED